MRRDNVCLRHADFLCQIQRFHRRHNAAEQVVFAQKGRIMRQIAVIARQQNVLLRKPRQHRSRLRRILHPLHHVAPRFLLVLDFHALAGNTQLLGGTADARLRRGGVWVRRVDDLAGVRLADVGEHLPVVKPPDVAHRSRRQLCTRVFRCHADDNLLAAPPHRLCRLTALVGVAENQNSLHGHSLLRVIIFARSRRSGRVCVENAYLECSAARGRRRA